MSPVQAEAWAAFLADTEQAREEYTGRLDNLKAVRDNDLAAAQLAHRRATHESWEAYNEGVTAAWRAYMSDTESARLRRDSATFATSELTAIQ
jgi:hypothetical protein